MILLFCYDLYAHCSLEMHYFKGSDIGTGISSEKKYQYPILKVKIMGFFFGIG
jgi:hypothetical protein